MYVHLIRRKSVARVWRFIFCLIVLLVTVIILGLVWDLFISVFLTVIMRRHQPYAQWDPQTFQKWKFQWELLIAAPTGLLMAIAIFVFVPFKVSFKPDLQPGIGSSEQHTALDGDNANTAAAQNAVDNGSNDGTAAVQNPVDGEPNDGTAVVQRAVNNRSNNGTAAEQHTGDNAKSGDSAPNSNQRTVDDMDEDDTIIDSGQSLEDNKDNHETAVDSERDARDNGDDEETVPVTRRAAPGTPVILELGKLPQLPEVVLQESPWSTETASDLLSVTGHDRTPDIRSSQRWASTAVRGPAEALNAHSSYSRAVIPAEVPNRTCIAGPSRSQGSTPLSGDNQTLIARPIHGRNLFPVRDPRCQKAGPTLNRASKARSIHDQAPNTSPSSDQNPMALQIFDRAPSFKPSSNHAPIAYQSYDQPPDPSPTPDQAPNHRSIYNRAPNSPPSSNQDSVALQNPDRDPFAEPGSIYAPTAFQSYGQALNTLPMSYDANLAFPPRSRFMGAVYINPRWEFGEYLDLPPGTPSSRPRTRLDGTPPITERDWMQASIAPRSHNPAPVTPQNLHQTHIDTPSPDLAPTSRANPSRTMGAIGDNLHWNIEGYGGLPPGTPSPGPSRRPDWTHRSTLLSRSGRSIPRTSPPGSASPGSSPNPSIFIATRPEGNVSSSEDPGASRRAYKQKLFEEVKTWKGHPSEARLKSLIMLDDENDDQPRRLIDRDRIDNDRRHYEYYAQERQTRDPNQPFSVYGTPEFHDLDVLKLWVNSNQHIYDTWPPGYTPKNTDLNERDDESSIFSGETSSGLGDDQYTFLQGDGMLIQNTQCTS